MKRERCINCAYYDNSEKICYREFPLLMPMQPGSGCMCFKHIGQCINWE